MSNPAELFMIVRALEYGLSAVKEVVEKQLDEFRATTSAKSFDTPLGTLVRTITKPSVYFVDEAAQVAWAREHMPHEVIDGWTETITVEHPAKVHPTLLRTLEKRVKIVGDDVVDSVTGEVIAFARVKPQSEKWTPRVDDEVKADAGNALLERLPNLAALVAPDRAEVEA